MNIQSFLQKLTRYSIQRQLIYLIAGILFLEFCTMLLLDLLPPLPLLIVALIDCGTLAILLTPMVFFVIRKDKKYQDEQNRITDALKESEMHFFTLANTGHALIWTSDSERKFNYFNLPWLFFTGRTLEQELGDGWLKGIHPEDLPHFLHLYESSFDHQEKFSIEFRLLHSSGEHRWIQNDASPRYNSKGECIGYIGHCLDISVRKQTEAYRETSRKILQILNEPGDIHPLIEQVASILKHGTGIDAVGIRMQKGEDFPFLAQDGFDMDFLLTENSLIERDEEGSICRDPQGQVCLACTCGAVISGRNKDSYPFSTPGGSWWTNESSQIQNIPALEDWRFHPRSRCIYKGYASLALVPIRDKELVVGLIQLNDYRKGRFTRDIIEKLEEVASHIGGAIMRKHTEELLRKEDERRLSILKTAMDGFWLMNKDGHLLEVNDTYCRMSGYTEQELLSMNVCDLEDMKNERDILIHLEKIKAVGEDRFETRHRRKDGSTFDIEVSVQYQAGEGGQFVAFIHDITQRKLAEKALQESEERVKFKLQSILSPEGSIADLELNDIIDTPSIQTLMDHFYELAQIPMAIIDRKGKVLVRVGWQDICNKFHRAHPKACLNCLESDVKLTHGIPEGEFMIYKCKNNLWDIATPIVIGGEHKGNLFMGQFFLDNETIDYALFRDQARKYDFDEKDYLEALEKAPRISQQKLDHAKAFFLNLSYSISKLSYSNIKLARAITQQQLVEETLKEKEELLSKAQEIAHLGSWSLDLLSGRLTWSDEIYRIFGLKMEEFPATYEGFLKAVHPDDREVVNTSYTSSILEGRDHYEIEHRIVLRKSGEIRHVYEKCQHQRDDSGKIVRSVGMVQDITERKLKEEALRKLNQTLAALGKSSKAMSQSKDEIEYLNQVCQIIVGDTDFAMVWIGFAEDDEAKNIRPMAHAGFNDQTLQSIQQRWDESKIGRGPTGTCIRTGQMSICNDIRTDPHFLPWREEALSYGLASSIVFPLKNSERTFGAISIYSKIPDSFHEAEIHLLSELANDLAQGINILRLRAAHQLAEIALNKAYGELEVQVKERTLELQITNDLLKKEIELVKQHQQSLKVAEEKYRLLSENITDGIFICRNGAFEYVNEAMKVIFGYEPNELLGQSIHQLIVPEAREEISFISSLETSVNQRRNIEIECLKKDRSKVLIEFLFNYVAKDAIIYGVAHDITDKRQLQKNIVKAIILTEEKEKAYFSKELHDGLGPLLSTIKIYLQWSEMELINQSREDIVKKAEEILEEAITTVKEISNKLSPHLLINHGLCSAIESFLDKLEEKLPIQIEFNYNTSRRLDSEIEAAVYRAIIECINNTIKYAQAKNITIDLTDTGNQLLIQYQDDGIGFDVQETLAVKKGLGLFNLQNRIQNIGGKILLFSEPGKGVNYRMVIDI